jgi:4-hydroxysphinganine ceramide fatty acyl 2-hydroxylase
MKDFKIDNKGSAQLFRNPVLEFLSRTNFLIPLIGYYALALIFLLLSFLDRELTFIHVLWIFPLGMITFSFVEYLIHRFLFHFNASTEKQIEFQYNIHGVHHEYPRDKDRLVMPPVISIFLAAFFYAVFVVTMGGYGKLFFAGFIAGYSTYLIIHYAVHALKPPKNFLKHLWRHHSHHHYSSVHTAFSVSFPLWDILFGTMPLAKDEEKKQIENLLPDKKT